MTHQSNHAAKAADGSAADREAMNSDGGQMVPEISGKTMVSLAGQGHNGPPHESEEVASRHADVIAEAENWLDGQPVANEAEMIAVDAIIKGMKVARKDFERARDDATRPLYEAHKAETARWKPTADDFDRIIQGLVSLVDGFKRRLASEKEAARRAAEREAWEKAEAARQAVTQASQGDIAAMRHAAQMQVQAEAAMDAANAAGKDTVKGMRSYKVRTIDDMRTFARWVWDNDYDALEAFMRAYLDRMPNAPPDGCGASERIEKRAV